MADELELVTTVIPGITRKMLDTRVALTGGDKVKMELGEAELDTVVPEGETWRVHSVLEIDVE